MAISEKINFTPVQLRQFAQAFQIARLAKGMTQLQVAQSAFRYKKSHCKVSRIERCAMPKVDAHCLELMAKVQDVPMTILTSIDPHFGVRAKIARQATKLGFWSRPAELIRSNRKDAVGALRIYPQATI